MALSCSFLIGLPSLVLLILPGVEFWSTAFALIESGGTILAPGEAGVFVAGLLLATPMDLLVRGKLMME